MAAQKKHNPNFNAKGINLLKDIYGREQVRKQVYIVYRSISIIFVFVLIVFSSIWGWTLYETTQLEKLNTGIEVKKAELSKYKEVVEALLAYSARVDQITGLRGSEEGSFVQTYDQLDSIRKQANGVLMRYKMLPSSLVLTFNLPDETALHWFESLVNENVKSKKKWNNMKIASVRALELGDYEVTLSTKLGKSTAKPTN